MGTADDPKSVDQADRTGTEGARPARRRRVRPDELVDLLIAYPHAFEVLTALQTTTPSPPGDRPDLDV